MKNPAIRPDLSWYMEESRKRKLTPRCPIASYDKCPRYYLSLLLLGEHSIELSAETKLELNKKWELTSAFANSETTAWRTGGTWNSYSNFCPEVIESLTGMFASDLAEYPHSSDKQLARKELDLEGADKNDVRRHWMLLRGRHFSECPEFSMFHIDPFAGAGSTSKAKRQGISGKL